MSCPPTDEEVDVRQTYKADVMKRLHPEGDVGLRRLFAESPSVLFARLFFPSDQTRRVYPPLRALRDWAVGMEAVARVSPRIGRVSPRPIHLGDEQRTALFYLLEHELCQATALTLEPVGQAIGLLTVQLAELLAAPANGTPLRVADAILQRLGATRAAGPQPALATALDSLYVDAAGPQQHLTPAHLLWLFEAIRTQPGVIEACRRPEVGPAFRMFEALRKGDPYGGASDEVTKYLLWKLGRPADPERIVGRTPLRGLDRVTVFLTGRPGPGRAVAAASAGLVVAAAVAAGLVGWGWSSHLRTATGDCARALHTGVR